MNPYYDEQGNIRPQRVMATIVLCLVGLVIGFYAIGFGARIYSRYQKVQDAKNQVTVESYNVEAKELQGKAALEEAKWSTQVATEKARAQLEAEKLNALAEVERAKGAAEAIKIEGGQLTERYIQYLWVRQNQFNDKTTIYIPTEANLPILEANPNR